MSPPRSSGVNSSPQRSAPPTPRGASRSSPPPLSYRRYHLIGRADQPDVVRARAEPPIETLIDHRAIPRVVGADSEGFDPRVVGRLSCRHRLLWIAAMSDSGWPERAGPQSVGCVPTPSRAGSFKRLLGGG